MQRSADYFRGEAPLMITAVVGGSSVEYHQDERTVDLELDGAGQPRTVEILFIYTEAPLTPGAYYTDSSTSSTWICRSSKDDTAGGVRYQYRNRMVRHAR
jgi:hypothetical protein